MGEGGEIFVFDMGKPVKILHLAERMIELSGFTPYKDIDISITGLRPGEKLYEELLGDKTKTLPTHNEKIMVAKDDYLPFPTVYSKTRQLVTSAVRAKSNKEMVRLLKDLVPEFISKNSEYEELDRPVPPREKKGKIHAS